MVIFGPTAAEIRRRRATGMRRTLARWHGVNDCDLDPIFPYLANFPTGTLGFMV